MKLGRRSCLSSFAFRRRETDIKLLFLNIFLREDERRGEVAAEEDKIAFILSDGRLGGRTELGKKMNQLPTEGVIVTFLVLDLIMFAEESIF